LIDSKLLYSLSNLRMEDPQRHPNGDPSAAGDDVSELQRQAEEAMEQMLLAQEDEEHADTEGNGSDNNNIINNNNNNEGNFPEQDRLLDEAGRADDEDPRGFAADGDENNGNDNGNIHDEIEFLEDDDDLMNNNADFHDSPEKKNPFTYIRVSFWAAVVLVYYAYRSRQQWYLALVFLSSSKYAYVILGNAFIASLVWWFRVSTEFFLNGGLRLNEAEGLGDYFRWHITETCLALTIFRSEMTVKTFVLFLVLVFAKCLHHIVDAREAHLRMTEEIVVANPPNGWISLRCPHVKLFSLIILLQVLDIISVVLCGQDIMMNGPSVSILFAFESAIMLTSVISNTLLWYLHLVDGILHFLHETSDASSRMHKWIYPWKDHKATLVFAVELQAQAAKFFFYLTFFSIVFTYYGLPINLIREVYVSFLALKSRLIAFHKYRQLMSSMNRFKNPSEKELEEEHICIICRDEMTVETAKRLPGCGHIMHKSCLREWLVQQQTCPTCRGDISAMEARQKLQDAMDARRQEQQQDQQEEEKTNHEGTEGETPEDNQHSSSANESGKNKPTDGAGETAQPASPEIDTEIDRKPPPRTNALASHDARKTIPAKSNSGIAASSRLSSGEHEMPTFPAFYRVVRDTGACVYRDEKEEDSSSRTCFLVLRVVRCGVVLLGMEMEVRKCVLANKMMIRMPDGWVNEDDLERIVSLPFKSSPLQ